MEQLVGENIVLRKARIEDCESIYRNIWSDTEVAKTMFWKVSTTLEEAKERIVKTIDYQKDKPMFFVALKTTDEPIGLGGIKFEEEGVYSEGGLSICRKYQHQGYGKEMLKLLLEYAFNVLKAEKFTYYCMDTNEISRNLALHFGFEYLSTEKETRPYDNQEFNIQKFVLSKDKYYKIRENY